LALIDLAKELLSGCLRTRVRFIGQVESHYSSRRKRSAGNVRPDVIGNYPKSDVAIDSPGGERVLVYEPLELCLRDVAVCLAAGEEAEAH